MTKTNTVQFGVASYGFREYSLPEFFKACKEMNITAVEIDAGWLLEESRNKISVDATPQEIDGVEQLASDSGVEVAALGGGAVVGVEGEVATDRSAEIMKVVDLAEALDARVIRVFTEHDFSASKHYVLPAEGVTDALYETLVVAFNNLGEYLKGKNVHVGIENHGGSSATGAGVKRLLNMVPHQEVVVTYDPANYAYGGEDPYEALKLIEDRVVYTHWKDVAHTEDGPRYRAFGEGEIDWTPIFTTLLKSFQGLWAIEFERKQASTLEALMEATRRSVENLKATMERVENQA